MCCSCDRLVAGFLLGYSTLEEIGGVQGAYGLAEYNREVKPREVDVKEQVF